MAALMQTAKPSPALPSTATTTIDNNNVLSPPPSPSHSASDTGASSSTTNTNNYNFTINYHYARSNASKSSGSLNGYDLSSPKPTEQDLSRSRGSNPNIAQHKTHVIDEHSELNTNAPHESEAKHPAADDTQTYILIPAPHVDHNDEKLQVSIDR
eukprot:CAMPEP_0202691534 /NCGR_PEP_ID=MMETSP1385-20130828/6231_1 /ASSEMBLY_ACC=CAM_ASM_000861 /TAXON_ID=933848 /ORGANISM="Elphidium margaritaceum" /LENGTH=154 /DNA_ID=CAMNT_0049346961 /DNA_START=44 /DNA_END=505 /DNA_ORIENTATION=+